MASRLLFLCARGSGRAQLAASLLKATTGNSFDVWSTPTQDEHDHTLVETISREQGIALLTPERLIQPAFGLRWDEGIILCSGLTTT